MDAEDSVTSAEPEGLDLWLEKFERWSGPEQAVAARRYHEVWLACAHRDFVTDLPEVVALHILSCLSPADLCRAARVSRGWRALVHTDALWIRMAKERGFADVHSMMYYYITKQNWLTCPLKSRKYNESIPDVPCEDVGRFFVLRNDLILYSDLSDCYRLYVCSKDQLPKGTENDYWYAMEVDNLDAEIEEVHVGGKVVVAVGGNVYAVYIYNRDDFSRLEKIEIRRAEFNLKVQNNFFIVPPGRVYDMDSAAWVYEADTEELAEEYVKSQPRRAQGLMSVNNKDDWPPLYTAEEKSDITELEFINKNTGDVVRTVGLSGGDVQNIHSAMVTFSRLAVSLFYVVCHEVDRPKCSAFWHASLYDFGAELRQYPPYLRRLCGLEQDGEKKADSASADTTTSDAVATDSTATDSAAPASAAADSAAPDSAATDQAATDSTATDSAAADSAAADSAAADSAATDSAATDSVVTDSAATDQAAADAAATDSGAADPVQPDS